MDKFDQEIIFSQDFLDATNRLWMGLGVKEEKVNEGNNETPAAAGETNRTEAVKIENSGDGDISRDAMDPGTLNSGSMKMEPGTTEPEHGVKRNLSQGESSKKQRLDGGDSMEVHTASANSAGITGNETLHSGNAGNTDIGSVFTSQTWEAYFATWDCRKKARGILARSEKLGASQSGQLL